MFEHLFQRLSRKDLSQEEIIETVRRVVDDDEATEAEIVGANQLLSMGLRLRKVRASPENMIYTFRLSGRYKKTEFFKQAQEKWKREGFIEE